MESRAASLPVKDLPSGSGWGADTIKDIRFAAETAKIQLEDFDQMLDLCFEYVGIARPDLGASVMPSVERDFGHHVTPGLIPDGLVPFYDILKELKGVNTRELSHTAIPNTRSTIDLFQSSPVSVNPSRTPRPDATAPSEFAAFGADNDSKEQGRNYTSSYATYGSQSQFTEQLHSVPNQTCQASPQSMDPQTPKIPKMPQMPLSTNLHPVPDQPSCSGTLTTSIAPRFVEVELSSSQEASTYYDGSSPIHSSEDSLQPDSVEKDQDEENTNFMMRVLLNYVCGGVQSQPEFRDNLSYLVCETPSHSLRVNVGGQMVKTKPDLQIVLKKGTEHVTIVYYEGKRLKTSYTSENKYGQQVCHLLGRAAYNSAYGRYKSTTFREVFLVTVHHTSASILTCGVKQEYLKLLAEGFKSLKKVDSKEVYEYGPVDLNNPEERVLFVKSIYLLIDFLCKVAIYYNFPSN